MLHKCGLRVYRRVEEAVAQSTHLQWAHFDAGVVKVRSRCLLSTSSLAQTGVWHSADAAHVVTWHAWYPLAQVLAELARLSEDDVIDELEALKRTDLQGLQHVPAYLNKRLNNRLWQRRKGGRGD